ncbi:hypothetical protein [Shewanella woodyi]|uniref:hypothetical protein n=1 Tax=Shewanella woodyi TaxID=60961 RepID=UPI0037481E35
MLTSDKLAEAPKEGEKAILGKTEIGFVRRSEAGLTPEESNFPFQCVLSQNVEYMDIGSSEIDHSIGLWVRIVCFMTLAWISMIALSYDPYDPYEPEFIWQAVTLFSSASFLLLCGGLCYYIFRRRRRTTVSFYRKRQKLVFKPSSRAEPVEIDWGDVVPYLRPRRIRGVIGSSRIDMPGMSFCLAWYDSESQTLHTFYTSEFKLSMFVADEWRLMLRYMNGDDNNFANNYEPVATSAYFQEKRDKLWRDFRANKNKRLFTFSLRDMSVSYLSMTLFYFSHLIGWWRIPYLFTDFYLACAVTPFLPSDRSQS